MQAISYIGCPRRFELTMPRCNPYLIDINVHSLTASVGDSGQCGAGCRDCCGHLQHHQQCGVGWRGSTECYWGTEEQDCVSVGSSVLFFNIHSNHNQAHI